MPPSSRSVLSTAHQWTSSFVFDQLTASPVLIGVHLKRGVCDLMPAVGQQDLLNDVHIDRQTHSSLHGARITATQVSATARTLLVCSPTMPRRLSDRVVPR